MPTKANKTRSEALEALETFHRVRADRRAHPDAIQAAWEVYTAACLRELEQKRELKAKANESDD